MEADTTARRRRGEGAPGACSLRVIVGDKVAAHPLPVAGELTLGRGGDIVIPSLNVSRRHVAFRTAPVLEVRDLGSTNQTTLLGVALEPQLWVPIRAGDLLVLGGEVLVMLHDGEAHSVPKRRMGRESLERALAKQLSDHEHHGTPFAVCTVSSRSSVHWLDVLAGVLLERDELVVLSDTEAGLMLANRSEDEAQSVVRTLEAHLGRIQAVATTRVRHCPRDGATAAALVESPATDNRAHRTTMRPGGPLVRNAAMTKLYALADEVAPTHVNVLLLGETGVGKDVLAHALHERSQRARAPFVSLNCSALPENLLESELFGYERGAFTGAMTAKPGLLETAEGGTIFLDEVGEMPLSTQAKLLRVLEERTVRRVGGLKPRAIDVRLIAATNRELSKEIAEGRFRADLFYRLNGLSLVVPPLRQRTDEIAVFTAHFMANAAAILNRPTPKLSPEARACLEGYAWPGNIRELRNAVERAVLLARSGVLSVDLLPPEISGTAAAATPPPAKPTPQPRPPTWPSEEPTNADLMADSSSSASLLLAKPSLRLMGEAKGLIEEVEALEKARIVEALASCSGNQTRAAELLGITRRVLIKRIERYNLPRPRGPRAD